MNTATAITSELAKLSSEEKAAVLRRFFKTGPGEYGEGDRFLGVKVPEIRSIVKRFKKSASLSTVNLLTGSSYHEERLAGFLLLVEMFSKAVKKEDRKAIGDLLDFYLSIIERGNNWDLVDLVAPKILGVAMLIDPRQEALAASLSESKSLWRCRVSIVSTLTLIKAGNFRLALDLAIFFANHEHDLIHKACGWMLREVGKKDRNTLISFLDRWAAQLPRTTLRYAIEHLPPAKRMEYMVKKDEAVRPSKKKPVEEPEPYVPMSHRLSIPSKKKNK